MWLPSINVFSINFILLVLHYVFYFFMLQCLLGSFISISYIPNSVGESVSCILFNFHARHVSFNRANEVDKLWISANWCKPKESVGFWNFLHYKKTIIATHNTQKLYLWLMVSHKISVPRGISISLSSMYCTSFETNNMSL